MNGHETKCRVTILKGIRVLIEDNQISVGVIGLEPASSRRRKEERVFFIDRGAQRKMTQVLSSPFFLPLHTVLGITNKEWRVRDLVARLFARFFTFPSFLFAS